MAVLTGKPFKTSVTFIIPISARITTSTMAGEKKRKLLHIQRVAAFLHHPFVLVYFALSALHFQVHHQQCLGIAAACTIANHVTYRLLNSSFRVSQTDTEEPPAPHPCHNSRITDLLRFSVLLRNLPLAQPTTLRGKQGTKRTHGLLATHQQYRPTILHSLLSPLGRKRRRGG